MQDKKIARERFGLDMNNPELSDTPRRVVDMYEAMFSGNCKDIKEFFGRPLPTEHSEMSCFRIPVVSLCPHHLMPFIGHVFIAVIPDKTIIGFSKYMSAVKCLARRPILQEDLASKLADAINDTLKPIGIMVVVKAMHMCTIVPGVYDYDNGIVQQPQFQASTQALRGLFKKSAKGLSSDAARQEALIIMDNMERQGVVG
jgi:GTP cyclohydrolase I